MVCAPAAAELVDVVVEVLVFSLFVWLELQPANTATRRRQHGDGYCCLIQHRG
jgi:hypothetical protein